MKMISVTLENLELLQAVAREHSLIDGCEFDIIQDDKCNLFIRYDGALHNRVCSITTPVYDSQTANDDQS